VLWDVATGKRLRSIQGDYPGNVVVAFSADSRQVLIGDWSGALHADSIETGAKTLSIEINNDPTITPYSQASWQTLAVAFSPDGTKLLAGVNIGDGVILCDAATRKQLRTFQGHGGWVKSVAFSSDGKQILTGAKDPPALLWDVSTGTKLRVFTGTSPAPIDVARFSPNGRSIVGVDRRGEVLLWDIATGDELCRIIVLEGDDWLIVTPQGLFDGPPSAVASHVRFRAPEPGTDTLVPGEKIKPSHYQRGLLADLLRGERPQP
jgi:WD40 repeat protein